MKFATSRFLWYSPTWNKASLIYQLHVTGQLPGERQHSRVLGHMRTCTTSQSWLEVDYGHLVGAAATVLQHPGPGSTSIAT